MPVTGSILHFHEEGQPHTPRFYAGGAVSSLPFSFCPAEVFEPVSLQWPPRTGLHAAQHASHDACSGPACMIQNPKRQGSTQAAWGGRKEFSLVREQRHWRV